MESNQKSHSLLKAVIISFTVAVVVLVLFILPAEYNIDPTGVGEKLGLTVFNEEIKSQATKLPKQGREDSVVLNVPAGKGIEYKLAMKKHSKSIYEWKTDGG